eukprot:7330401-Prymnesium_polylepis.2
MLLGHEALVRQEDVPPPKLRALALHQKAGREQRRDRPARQRYVKRAARRDGVGGSVEDGLARGGTQLVARVENREAARAHADLL